MEIPVILSLTGQGAFLGGQVHDALQLAEKTANQGGGIHGSPIHMAFHDDQSSPQISVQLMNEVIAAHAPLVLGSTLVADCNAMAPLTAQAGYLVQYCFSPGIHPAAGSYVFTSSSSTLDLEKALVRYFRLRGWTRLALATSTDATGQDADRGFAEVLADPENKPVTLAAHVHFNVTDVSVSAQMEQIRAASPQAVIVWSTGTPVGTMLRGLIQAGIDLPVGTTGGNMTFAQMKLLAAVLPKEFYFPSAEWPVGNDPRITLDPAVVAKQKEYYAAFAAAGLKPDEGSILGWDPGIILVDALRTLPPGANATQLRDYLLHQTKAGAASTASTITWKVPQRGLSIDDVVITAWDAGAGTWRLMSQPAGTPLAPMSLGADRALRRCGSVRGRAAPSGARRRDLRRIPARVGLFRDPGSMHPRAGIPVRGRRDRRRGRMPVPSGALRFAHRRAHRAALLRADPRLDRACRGWRDLHRPRGAASTSADIVAAGRHGLDFAQSMRRERMADDTKLPDAMSNPIGGAARGGAEGSNIEPRLAYRDLREWIEEAKKLGELRSVKGASWQTEIGMASEVVLHDENAPAVLFEDVPGTLPGSRVLVNFFGAKRQNMTLGFPTDLGKLELTEEFRKAYMADLKQIPPKYVTDAPILENIMEGDDIDVTKFPTPKWHEEDGGRYIGTGSYNITKDPDEGLDQLRHLPRHDP